MIPDEQEKLVKELETALDRLQALYNQYFMGIERIEPTIPRKDVDRRIAFLRKEKIRNTALRFRFQTQIQKYNTHANHWRRICRQIEEGTYERDIKRAKKRVEHLNDAKRADEALKGFGDEKSSPAVYDLSMGLDSGLDSGLDMDDPFASFADELEAAGPSMDEPGLDESTPRTGTPVPKEAVAARSDTPADPSKEAAQPKEAPEELSNFFSKRPDTKKDKPSAQRRVSLPPPPPPPPPARKRAAPPPAIREKPAPGARGQTAEKSSSGVTDDRMKTIYRSYVAARKKTNESVDGLSYEKMSKLLNKKIAAKGEIADFKVVIRGGKAVIKMVKR